MFCTKSRERDYGEAAIKQSFLTLVKVGFKVTDALVILGLKKIRVMRWLKSDVDFCDEIKSFPVSEREEGS